MARVFPQSAQTITPIAAKPKRSRFSFFRFRLFPRSCLGQLIFGLALIIFSVAALVAYLGVAKVPVFTPLFYRPLQPVRSVQIESGLDGKIGLVLGERFASTVISQKDGLEISESELTVLIQKSLLTQDSIFREIQAAVEAEGVEFYGQLISQNRTYRFAALAKPMVKEGQIDFKITKAKIERLPLPASLVNALLHEMLKVPLKTLNNEAINYVKLKTLKTEPGALVLTGQVLNPKLPF
ncbi:MAG: hypothetical protein PHI73_02490 [Patescibacteria group bacterium]|nr:hypothetical protein [Patescibacteria group bacterium]